MSLTYNPDSAATPNNIWDTTFLSDRDVSGQVPINFVPHPGIHVTPACFNDRVYDLAATQTCLSNLLASQIRRYVFDVYWDTVQRRFGFCPVEIPNLNTTSVPVVSSTGSDQLLQLGPYQCSSDLSLLSATSLFESYLDSTSNNLEAKISIWILNVHVAAPYAAPTEPRPSLNAAQLPAANELVRSYFNSLESVLYTPGLLLSDRSNLNASWLRVSDPRYLPLTNYYQMTTLSNGDLATNDGWPNELYIQISRNKRILVGFGTVDQQLGDYNITGEGDRLFQQGVLSVPRQVSFNSNGQLESGCFFESNNFSISQTNNSWSVATLSRIDPPNLGYAADNLTVCGISPVVNSTINGSMADTSPQPYSIYGNQAVFSWAYGQPENDSSAGVDSDAKFRCALMVSNDTYRGHWKVEYCSKSYRAACREGNAPYRWQISQYSVPYGSADSACTGNTTFDVPRTGLENTYLYWHILNSSESDTDHSLQQGVWINFNSLDYQSCWVTTGENGECPYIQNSDATHSRQILIPTIAALIVLILTVLTILVKCTTNRRNSRTRKRGEGGWDYEGVPS